ncbi:MAG: DNA-3-methyladenine glycosylase I, partial [Hyphomicrobiales bacterium]|nr:DNA-3-methyladenine glycosylase I [Hyphomicrobiales bacterium]
MVQTYQAIFARAAERHGSAKALEAKLAESRPKSSAELAALPDDRWLAEMTRRIFQAGFNWSVIDNKWDGFEAAFEGFDVGRWAMAGDDDLDRLARDTRIVRNPQKIRTVRENAVFLSDLAKEHGSAARFFADYPVTDQVGLMDILKKRGSRLGGTTAQYLLRLIGKDAFVLSRDVTAALIAAGVINKPP